MIKTKRGDMIEMEVNGFKFLVMHEDNGIGIYAAKGDADACMVFMDAFYLSEKTGMRDPVGSLDDKLVMIFYDLPSFSGPTAQCVWHDGKAVVSAADGKLFESDNGYYFASEEM